MRVADVMSKDVEFIDPNLPVSEAAVLMGELDVGALPAGSAAHVEGILTDRDILYRVVAQGLDSSQVRIRDILSRPVIMCREDDGLEAAMDLMAANHIRRMPVQNEAGQTTGWITLADISRRLLVDSGDLQRTLQTLTEQAA